jgi:hypothetical protein
MKRSVLIPLALFLLALGAFAMTTLPPAQATTGISVLEDPILPPGMPLPPRPTVYQGLSALEDPNLPPGMPLPPPPVFGVA